MATTAATDLEPSLLAVRLVASAAGSLVTALAVTPLDVVKVRQQAAQADTMEVAALGTATMARCSSCGIYVMNNGLMEHVVQKSKTPHFKPHVCGGPIPRWTVPGIAHIYRTEGLAGLYAGLSPTLVMAVPATMLYFVGYEELRERFTPWMGNRWSAPLAGACARVLSATVTSPLELVRTLVQAGEPSTRNGALLENLRSIVRNGGYTGLWAGLEPTLWRDVPFSALYWAGVESSKTWLQDNIKWEGVPAAGPLRAFASGAVAGVVSAVMVTPFDVVKTRRQLYSTMAADPAMRGAIDHSVAAGNGSTPAVIDAILRTEGLRGMFRGAGARVMKITPACAIMIGTYEAGKAAFSQS